MHTRSSLIAVAVGALAGGCFDRPHVLLLCHNSNCTEPHDVSRDDTVAAMQASLALVGDDGRPIIDGIELDLLLFRGQCLYAHDVEHTSGHVDIRDAAAVLSDHLMTHPIASHNREQFNVKLELKPAGVDSEAERVDQVTCALDTYEILRAAARASAHRIEFVFDSYNPALLRAVHGRRPPDEAAIWTRLSIDYGVPPPLRNDNYPQADIDVPIDIAEVHGSWITDTALRSLQSRGVELSVWNFDLTRETLEQIQRLEPRYALTGQAQTLRAWLDY